MTVLDEFWLHVDKTGGPERLRWETGEPCHGDGSPCWMWLRAIRNGYGRCGRRNLAHRVAWELENGPIPPKMTVLHWCDHPACVNPDHLYLGTQADVVLKRDARGHHGSRTHPEKYAHCAAKLTEEYVREIRRLHRTGMRQMELMWKYNVSDGTISRICNGVAWRHVKDETNDD
jgi:hypothetical protein